MYYWYLTINARTIRVISSKISSSSLLRIGPITTMNEWFLIHTIEWERRGNLGLEQVIHGELVNYTGLVGICAEGEGMKDSRFDHRPIHQTPTNPLKILKVSKGFQGFVDDQDFVNLGIKITIQTHNSHNFFQLSGISY